MTPWKRGHLVQASLDPATPASEFGSARSEEQFSAGLASLGAVLGGIGFLYGSVTATERYGVLPWAAVAVLLAAGALLATAASAACRRLYVLGDHSRAACYAHTLASWLDWEGPEAMIVAALGIWVPFAAYGLITLAHGM